MFSGTGHQIYGGTYYNVNGNINMQTHHHQHLEIQNLPQSAPLQLEEGGSQVRLAIKDHEGDPTPPLYHRNQGTLPGVTRNPHHPSPARWAPYNATSRPLHQIHPTADEETSSSNHQNPHKGHVDSEPLQQSGPHPQQGGIHITAQNVHTQHGDAGMQILLRFVALEGLHNSADSVQQPRCHPETRVNMLDTIYTWMIGEGSAEPTGWLYGPAGAGKSAVMQSLAQRLQEAGRLGGAFFFKRGHPTCGNAKELFTTLAYQLAENDDRLRPVISQTVERSSTVVARDMQTQFHHLIMEPCQSLVESLPPILLIDGLDECQEECVQLEILHLIGRAAHLHQYPRGVRVLIASRPEAAICEVFTDPNFDGLLKRFNIEQSFKDVQTYLMAEFARIHREHRSTMGNIPTPWPSPEIIRSLVDKSSGYFVYPSTVIKFVDDKFFRPTERLHEIQNLHSSAPFKALDQLYIHILSTVPDQFRSGLSNILQCLALQLMMTVEAMDSLFEWQQGDCQLILRGVHSLLKIPPESEHGSTLAVQHASLLDFLNNEERSLAFHLNLNTRTSVIHAILKAFGTAGSVRSAHLHSPFLRAHQGHQLMRTIVSLPPTSELVLLVRNINPDLLWWNTLKRL
ncbi:hypothetical protein C8R46DRAFT_257871 [Mycena filopes]|nr:hypothetical protein C8R46DRAFT_257871 [Mycena filopes]